MKNIEIASVKMLGDGTNGLEIKYKAVGVNQNREFIDIITLKKKTPIHKELEDCFSWLKEHVLDICGYRELDVEQYDLAKTYTDVTGITYGEKGFIITAKMWVLDRTKVISLNTPLITSEADYSYFTGCCKIMDGIYAETKEYIGGNKIMTDEQLIIKFNKKNEEFDFDAVKAMTPAEKKAEATRILEDMGSIVIHNDEMEEDTEEVAAPVEIKAPTPKAPAKKAVVKASEPEPVVEEVSFDFEDEESTIAGAFAVEQLEEEFEETDLTELAAIPEPPAPKKTKKIAPADVKAVDTDEDFSLVPLLAKTK